MKISKSIFSLFFLMFLLLDPLFLSAHTVAYDFANMTQTDIGFEYLMMGFLHIIPLGYDHILFVLGIYLLQPRLKTVIMQATSFTVAHSITLGLAMFGYIKPPSSIIEPVIALSIVFIAVENILISDLRAWRLVIIFLFGLIHGCGFASVLAETGLPQNNFILALISFNGGVEIGQICVIFLAYFLFGRWMMYKTWYRKRIIIPASFAIALIAFYWTIERIIA